MATALTYTVFTDFDGTIAVQDIGDDLFVRFGDPEVCSRSFHEYRTGVIDAKECWRRGFATLRPVTKEEFSSFACEHAVDAHFPDFVAFCDERKIPVRVVSDGYDAYIGPVLKQAGLERLERFSNTLEFLPDGSVRPVFPYTNAECPRCANCKRDHLLTRSSDEEVIVYIGDGVSDRCPAGFADIVFAKDALVGYCETHNITFHRFHDFSDVLKTFRTIVETKTPRKRRTAELARHDIFLGE